MSSKPEVVVSGIGGIFPKCYNVEEFIDLLLENRSAEEPAKWLHGGQTTVYHNNYPDKRHLRFDGSFFGVHRSQAIWLDPIMRLFLEATFAAVIDAGLHPSDISGRNIPVLCSSTISENNSNFGSETVSGFGIVGRSKSMIGNRVSYYLNLKGASEGYDADWNGGVCAMEAAVNMIQAGLCEAAIVGAKTLSVGPSVHQLMEKRGLLCKDGKTKVYSEQSDGYCRSDCTVVLFIQRADQAKRSYASLLYAECIFSGIRKKDLLGYHEDDVVEFLKSCYEKSGIDPKDVSYLETNGCGLKDLDKLELAAVERVFCKDRKSPLQVGSVKTNVGHTEPVSGLVSLIKIIVAMETGILPAHLHYTQGDTEIPALKKGTIEVVDKNIEWKGDLAAINVFGFSTSYGHMIVRRTRHTEPVPKTNLPLLLNYSTRTEEGIVKINKKVVQYSTDLGYNKLVQDVFSRTISGHLYRGYTLKASVDKQGFKRISGMRPPIWFVYSGMGSQWQTMGRDLMQIAVFAKSVTKCHETLKPFGVDLLKIILDDDPHIFDNILNSFVGIAAVQIGLTDILESIGIVPDGMIGHSVGELGCAYGDKCLTAEQMILSAYYRGKASLEAELIVGMMAAIGMGYSAMKRFCPGTIEIACHNSRDSCTISGPKEDVEKFVDVLKAQGTFARLVNVSNIAYHSQYIKPAAPLLLSYLKKVITHPKKRSTKWICTSIPQSRWETDLAKTVSPEYLTNNLLSSVLFEEGLPFIPEDAVLIEIAPHGLLQAILKRALPLTVTNIPLTKRESNCSEFLFNALGELYLAGIDFNASSLYPEIPVPAPRGTRSLGGLIGWEHDEEWPLAGLDSKLELYEKLFSVGPHSLDKNRIDSKIFVPFWVYFDYIYNVVNKHKDITIVTIEDITFHKHIEISSEDSTPITVMYQIGSGYIEISQPGKLVNQGEVILSGIVKANDKTIYHPASIKEDKEITAIIKPKFYEELKIRGHEFSEENKLVSAVALQKNGLKATIEHTQDIRSFLSSVLQIHLFNKSREGNEIYLPKYIQRAQIKVEDFEKTTQDYSVWFNNQTGIMETNCGIYFSGIEYEEISTINMPVKIENDKFTPHISNNIQEIETCLNTLTEIVFENISHDDICIVQLKEKQSPSYLPYIEKYSQNRNIAVKISEINDPNANIPKNPSLAIVSGPFLNTISQLSTTGDNFILLCYHDSQILSLDEKFIVICHLRTKSSEFLLVKLKSISPVKVINIKDIAVSYRNIQNIPWTAELEASVIDGKRLFVVCRMLPVEGIDEFVRKMQSLAIEGQKFRFLFILNSLAPECNPECEFYSSIFEQDLMIQVLLSKTWGNYIDVSKTAEENLHSQVMKSVASSSDLLKMCKPKYLSLHLKDLTRTNCVSIPCEIGALDFAGTNGSGQQVMGFGQLDLDQYVLKTDPEFVWPVPTSLSMHSAVNIPYAYTMAYYTLFNVASLQQNDTVLIHGGATEVGIAALNLAYNLGNVVYTTVETSMQRSYINKMIPTLRDSDILDSSPTNYVNAIRQITRGQGVQIVVNCYLGTDHIEASKSIISTNGTLILLGSADLNQYQTMRMCKFMDGISCYSVTGQHLLQLPKDTKHHLHEMIENGIKQLLVTPIIGKFSTKNRFEDDLRYLQRSNSYGAIVAQVDEMIYKNVHPGDHLKSIKSQGSYLVYADSSNTWLVFLDWLIDNGAKQILLANVADQDQDFVKHYVSVLMDNYNIGIKISKNNAATPKDAKSLVNDVVALGGLNETFLFAISEDKDHKNVLDNLDDALRQSSLRGRIVCLLGENRDRSYSRKTGLSICNISWKSSFSIHRVFKHLDMTLKTNSKFIYLKDDILEEESKTAHSKTLDVSAFLPSSLRALKLLSHSDTESAKLITLSSNNPGPGLDVPPIFLVPGLSGPHSPRLKDFAAQMMCPVFCVLLPSSAIEANVVDILTEQIISVFSGIYKIIGVSWGGSLALEITKKLEILGKKVELFIVDGDPKTIQSFSSSLYTNGTFDFALLKEYTKIDGKNIKSILLSSDISRADYKDIVKSLTVLKNRIEFSKSYKSLRHRIRGPVTLVQPIASEKNINFTEHSEQFRYQDMKVNRRNILQHKETILYLNDNICID